MRSRVTFCLSALILVLGALFTSSSPTALAAVPDSVNYQGILRTASGSLVPDGSYGVTFKIYNVSSGGVALWTETKNVTTTSGLFTTLLGSVTALPASVFSGPSRYLGITVAADPEMAPRTAIVAVAYAFRIATVDGATGGSISGDVSVSGGNLNLDPSTPTSGNVLKGGIPFIHDFGLNNTFIGHNSGNLTMSGQGNTASGDLALYRNISGNFNSATGLSALYSNTSGGWNTASGASALSSNTSGNSNTASGNGALNDNTSGGGNTADGVGALYNNTTGFDNAASGTDALFSNNTGNWNTASGDSALANNTTGYFNTASGEFALASNTTGGNNTASGARALFNNTTGNDNTAVGNEANVSSGALTNATAIGSGATVAASNNMMFGNASVVGWGFGVTPAAGHCLQVGTGATNGNGAYLTTGGAWTNGSDRNTKEGITKVDARELLRKVNQLPVYRWNYKGEDHAHQHVGPMAQDFRAVFGLGDDDKHISTIDPAGVALAAIQALYEQQKSENAKTRAENAELRAQIAELREMIRAQASKQK